MSSGKTVFSPKTKPSLGILTAVSKWQKKDFKRVEEWRKENYGKINKKS